MEKAENLFSYSLITRDIRVTVIPNYLDQESNAESGAYAFSYEVTIENFSDEVVQLRRRHWIVKSAGVVYTEVTGEGVVGEQPELKPSQGFQYTSGCVIKDPVGSMFGSYTFVNMSGDTFEVVIPEFDLVCKDLLH